MLYTTPYKGSVRFPVPLHNNTSSGGGGGTGTAASQQDEQHAWNWEAFSLVEVCLFVCVRVGGCVCMREGERERG